MKGCEEEKTEALTSFLHKSRRFPEYDSRDILGTENKLEVLIFVEKIKDESELLKKTPPDLCRPTSVSRFSPY